MALAGASGYDAGSTRRGITPDERRPMSPDIFHFLEAASPFFFSWSCAFTLLHTVRILRKHRLGIDKVPDSAALTELAGLPLTLLQSVCFVWAVIALDWLSMLLFLWWGPGFVFVLAVVIRARLRGRRIDWRPWRYLISFLCKFYYLAYVAAFWYWRAPGILFAFSAWVLNDQYEKAFMSLDADRTRRTFHDLWLFRVLYPAGLLAPWLFDVGAFASSGWRVFARAYGTVLLALWLAGLWYVKRRGAFLSLPDDPSLLRNMVYFPELRVQEASGPAGKEAT
jgi:hypothetical protein